MKKLAILIIVAFLFSCEKKEDNPDIGLTPDIPTATAASDITNSSFYANWTNSSNATSYEIDIATDSDFNNILKTIKAPDSPASISSLTNNTKYHYRVRALNGNNASSNSNVIDVFTLPLAPYITIDKTTKNSFNIWWQRCGFIITYRVYVSTNNFPTSPQNCLPNYDGLLISNINPSCTITGLTPGTTYYCIVKTANGNILSLSSNVVSCTTLN